MPKFDPQVFLERTIMRLKLNKAAIETLSVEEQQKILKKGNPSHLSMLEKYSQYPEIKLMAKEKLAIIAVAAIGLIH